MKPHPTRPIRSELENIRIRLSNRFIVAAAWLSPVALMVGLTRAIVTGWDPMVILHVGIVCFIWIATWRRDRIHHNLKSALIVAMLLSVGAMGVFQNGLLAPAVFYLVVAPSIASMLFGKRAFIGALGIVVIAVAGAGIHTVWTGQLPQRNVQQYMTSPIGWLLELAILTLVIALLQVAVGIYISSLFKYLTTTHRHEKHLIARNALLEQKTDALRLAHEETLASLDQNAAMVKRLDQVIRQTIDAFATATVHTDPYTAGHEKRVTDLSLVLGRRLGFSDDRLLGLELAANAHDVGQLRVPIEILLRPQSLTGLEFKFIQLHAEAGWEILNGIEFPWPVAEIVREHHENFDGTGYPMGLKGEAILLEARIIRAADLIEAMSSHRPFRPAHSREEVIRQVAAERGCALDPQISDICLEVLAEEYVFPPAVASTVRPTS